ncbi:MAG: Trm112 family protein [Methanoregulaceae archaeon]|nr:Trm112 family protein [Methanoregulaceae archaeon]
MRRQIIPLLCCPTCKGDLSLTVVREDETEILEGMLHCLSCKVKYPIEEGIPDLLPRT